MLMWALEATIEAVVAQLSLNDGSQPGAGFLGATPSSDTFKLAAPVDKAAQT
jgi:hypothetical protein